MASTVADVMVATLKASGVRRVYGIPGDSLNGFTDAMRRDGGITWEHVRHEEAAAFAAAAEAALTGELAVCAASCGPGNLHLINGLFDANRSGVPVLAIASHIPGVEIGGEYFQETHPQELFRECSVYCELASVPAQLPRLMEMAMRAALQRRGVGVVVVPGEVFLADAPRDARPARVRAVSPVTRPDEESLAAAAQVLNSVSRVTILAGAGCAGAHDQLIALAAALQAPVVHAFRGKEFAEYDNPYDVGMTGLIGFGSGYRAMEHCDALVMLGTDFPYRPFYPEGVPVIQVDVRGERIGRRVPVDVPLVGTVKDTVDALLPLIRAKTRFGAPGPDDRALPAGPQPSGPGGRNRAAQLAGASAVPGGADGDGDARGPAAARGRRGRGSRRGVPRRRAARCTAGPGAGGVTGHAAGRGIAGRRGAGTEQRQPGDHPRRGGLRRRARPRSTGWPRPTRSSPRTSARRASGPPATCA